MDASAAIVTINELGTIQSVDRACCKLFGYTLDELLGQSVNLLIPTPYKEQHDSYLERYRRTGVPRIIGTSRTVEGLHKDGTVFPVRLSVTEVALKNAPKLFVGTIEALREVAAVIKADERGIITAANAQAEALWGYERNELVGKKLNVLMPAPYSEQHDSYVQAYKTTGVAKVINHVRNVPARHRNGTVFPISLLVRAVQVDGQMTFVGEAQTVSDKEAVLTLDSNGLITASNRTIVLPLFGYEHTELLGKHINLLMPALYSKINRASNLSPGISAKPLLSYDSAAASEATSASVLVDGGENSELSALSRTDLSTRADVPEMEWRVKGTRRVEAHHKDGSQFHVDLEVSKFMARDGSVMYSAHIRRAEGSPSGSDSSGDRLGNAGSSGHSSGSGVAEAGHYVLGAKIGHGAYGVVKLGRHKLTGQTVAIKILQKDLMGQTEYERARLEIDILRQLDHPNIAKMYEAIETPDRIYIVMEYCNGGELQKYILQQGSLSEEEARKYIVQLIRALTYCHGRKIIHRDIKHKNILLHDGAIKLIDFGLSNFTLEGDMRSTFCGTPAYAAPEMIMSQRYVGPEVDVWSLGVVLFGMVTGKYPFRTMADILKGNFTLPSHVSKECSDLLTQIFCVDAVHRITLDELAKHPWLQKCSSA